jgi:tRNA (guanine37-N1)-methyltransferase
MLCLKVPLKEAEKVKKELLSKDLLDTGYFLKKDKSSVYFPVKVNFDVKGTDYRFVQKVLQKKEQRQDMKTSLSGKLSSDELKQLKTSLDVIGSIAIVEIPDELKPKEKLIAQEIMKANKNVKTVLRKGKHEGEFRIQKLAHIAGQKTKETVHRENNVVLKLDVDKVYFSPRLSNERKRIARQIKKPEDVLVMFSGCAPYVCVIAKNTPARLVDGIEINPIGHEYAKYNVMKNKLHNANVFLGDVKEEVPKLNKNYDRIVMPAPKTAGEFLHTALVASKKGTIIHFYEFQNEGEFDRSVEKIAKACEAAGKQCKVLDIATCGQNAPHQYRICVDFQIL